MKRVEPWLGGLAMALVVAVGHPLAAAQGAKPVGARAFQEATAISIGNLAWEAVKVSDLHQEGPLMKWTATTPLGVWGCQSQPDGKKPYCERRAATPRPTPSPAPAN